MSEQTQGTTDTPSSEPVCAQAGPFGLELQPGKYLWCTCGRSEKQPFCDGAHNQGTTFKPLLMDVKETQVVWLCGCKITATAPLCDGAHRKFL